MGSARLFSFVPAEIAFVVTYLQNTTRSHLQIPASVFLLNPRSTTRSRHSLVSLLLTTINPIRNSRFLVSACNLQHSTHVSPLKSLLTPRAFCPQQHLWQPVFEACKPAGSPLPVNCDCLTARSHSADDALALNNAYWEDTATISMLAESNHH